VNTITARRVEVEATRRRARIRCYDVGVSPEAIPDEARRRSDEAVRRLREESRRRIEQAGRWRAFSSWCALATLAAGISLSALNAHEARVRQSAELEAPAPEDRIEKACARRSAALAAIDEAVHVELAEARAEDEITRIRTEAVARALEVIDAAAGEGCAP
jgi:hypothetical protein